jgi:ABC-type transporter Mla MlaB component
MEDVMLRISSDGMTVRLEGQVAGPWVDELAKACDQLHPAALDLTEVTFADRAGVALIKALERRKVQVNGLSPFMEEQLKQSAS